MVQRHLHPAPRRWLVPVAVFAARSWTHVVVDDAKVVFLPPTPSRSAPVEKPIPRAL